MFIQAVQAATQPQSPWVWLLQYLPVIGWPTVILAAVRVSWKLSSFLTKAETRTDTAEKNLAAVVASNNELKEMLRGQVGAQEQLAQSVHQLADAIHHQSDMHAEQLGLIREMVGEQKLLAQKQMVIMNGFQRVVEQLIDAVKE